MSTYYELDWSCVACNHHIDATTSLSKDDIVAQDGDITLCINCGRLYVRKIPKWIPLSEDEYQALSNDFKSYLSELEIERQKVVDNGLDNSKIFT